MNRIIVSIFITLIVHSMFAGVVFEEQFENNHKLWNLPNTHGNQCNIVSGSCEWKRQGELSDVLMQYINRLDENDDFTIEAHIQSKKFGSEYGIVWGGSTKGDSKFFLIKGNKFRVLEAGNNRILSSTDPKTNLAIKSDNYLKIVKSGSKISYLVNDTKLYEDSFTSLNGKQIGLTLWGSGAVSIDYLKVSGTALPVNSFKNLYYPEEPQNLGVKINSAVDEMTPIISPDGEKLYFSRRAHAQNIGGQMDIEDAYVSIFNGSSWSPAKNMGKPVNNGGPNAIHSISPDGNTLLLINTYDANGRQKGAGLSMSRKTANGWSVPEDVKVNGYYNKSGFNEFFMSNNGKVLILAIQQDDAFGGRDLYVSFRGADDIWSKPRNMGVNLNTPGTELSPFLASDGVTLYFSSNGHPGLGKNDVFISRRLDNTWTNWSKPQNLGEPINGVGVDSYYSVPASGEYAYFVSTEDNAVHTDIFRVKLPEKVKPKPVVIIKGFVRNSKTKEAIGTGISYRDFADNMEMGVAHSDPTTGYYEIVLPLEKAYSFYADKRGFYSIQDQLDLKSAENYKVIERDLYLTPIEIGQTARLNNVLFVRSKAVLLPGSFAELNRLVAVLNENPKLKIEVAGHTDNVGNADLNLKLSQDRAEAVSKYLVKKGINENRIVAKGFGGVKPIESNEREETRRLNRRVEFTITSY